MARPGVELLREDPSRTTDLVRELASGLRGDVHADPLTRSVYATDASLYEETPAAVVLPKSIEDVVFAHRVARERGLPILTRGGGTSLAGQATGPGLVLDTTRYLRRVLEVDPAGAWARVEPGVVRDELNAHVAELGRFFGPETATSSRATIGGMIANDSSGTRSIVYGKTSRHVLELQVLLSTGEILRLAPRTPDAWARLERGDDREGALCREISRIVRENRSEIDLRFPKVMRRVMGYALDAFPEGEPWSLARLVCGSEGTLATNREAKVALEWRPRATGVLVLPFRSLRGSLEAVPRVLELGPSAVELLDRTIMDLALGQPEIRRRADFLGGDPEAVLLVEMTDSSDARVEERLVDAGATLVREGLVQSSQVRIGEEATAPVWEVRRAGLGLLARMRGTRRPIPFIEDAAVPVAKLANYIDDVELICAEEGVRLTLYAHASVGLLHVRPVLDLGDPADVERMKRIAGRAFERVIAYEGSFSGEHGDGRVRSPFLETFFGPQLTAAFREVKRAFDPGGLLNPGKIVDPAPMDTGLRARADRPELAAPTAFRFREEGGLGAAVERCTGVGACRQRLAGTMCPSFRATGREVDSTRGRANALRRAMTGGLGRVGLASREVHEALDLCLSCKACATECPSGVDMARMKSEHLAAWHASRGVPLRTRLFAAEPWLARKLSGRLAEVASAIAGSAPARLALARLGIAPERRLPSFAGDPLPAWQRRRGGVVLDRRALDRKALDGGGFAGDGGGPGESGGPGEPRRADYDVVLFADTYTAFHEAAVGRAAVRVLERAGRRVAVADVGCCQRPSLSLGRLRAAARGGARTVRALDATGDVPIVVLEPSCASALAHDLPDLALGGRRGESGNEGGGGEALDRAAERTAARVRSLDAFLAEVLAADGGADAADASNDLRRAFEGAARGLGLAVHGHCHRRALEGLDAVEAVLGRLPSSRVATLDTGCCGMAGAFGYEAEHYDVSMRIGADRLFPIAARLDRGEVLVADGFSCRHQLRDGLDLRALHLAEVLDRAFSGAWVPGQEREEPEDAEDLEAGERDPDVDDPTRG